MLRFIIFTWLAFLSAQPSAFSLELDEVFERVREQSELLQSAEVEISISASERDRILSTRRPRVSLNADGSYHVEKLDKRPWGNRIDSGVRTEFRQPLYDGGLSQAAIQNSDASTEAVKWDFKVQEQNIYLQTASLFYELLSQRKDLENLEQTSKVYRERIATLAEREKIGRSRDAEVLSARTQLELLRSMIAAAKTNISAAEEELAWLSGLSPPLRLEDSVRLADLRTRPSPGKYVLPSVEAAQARIDAATATIDLTRSDLTPKIDFIAAHNWRYLDASQQGSHDFAIGLGLNWLIYDAGEVNAAVSTASFVRSRAAIAKQLAEREGGLNLTLSQRRLEDGLEQIRTYQTALDVVEKTSAAQQREFESGLITNLELLTTMDQKLQIRRNLDLAIFRAKLAYIQAQVYSGSLAKK